MDGTELKKIPSITLCTHAYTLTHTTQACMRTRAHTHTHTHTHVHAHAHT